MADQKQRDKIEYEFDDLRRNSDPVSNTVLAQLGIGEDEDAERQDGKKRKESATRKDDEDLEDDRDERDDDEDLDDDGNITLSRKELARQIQDARRTAERKARKEIQTARAEVATVVGKLEKRVDGIERTSKADEIDGEFAPKIADIQEQIEAAMEAGDSKKVIELNTQLGELTADRKLKKHQAKTAADTTDDLDDEDGKKPKTIPRAQEWIDDQDWFDDPEYGYVRAYLNKLDKELQRKGYRPTDDDYYEKLEAKLDQKFPDIITRTVDGVDDRDDEDDEDDDRGRRSRRDRDDDDDRRGGEFDDIAPKSRRLRRRQRGAASRSPVSEGDRGGVNRERKNRREREGDTVTLNRSQIANMRAFGLDPDNTKHVEEYTLEVKRSRRADR
jgi:hypothetical protein